MSDTLHIVATTMLSALGLAFLVWLYYYTLKRSYDPALIIFKELLTVALVLGEIFFVRSFTKQLGGGMVGDFGTAFVIVGSIAVVGIILSIVWTPQISDLISSSL